MPKISDKVTSNPRKEAPDMQAYFKNNKQALQDLVLLCISVLACFLFFRYLSPIFLPFFIGWLISLLFNPLADRLEKHKIPRGIGTLLGILLLFGVLGLLGFWSGNSILDKAQHFSENLPFYMELAETKLQEFWHLFDEFLLKLPPPLQKVFLEFQNDATGILLSLIPTGGNALGSVSNFFIAFFVALVSSYFFTKDKELLHSIYQTHAAPLLGLSVNTTKTELKASIWGYIKTQIILMGFTFTISLIGMLLIGSPYALLLSVLISLIDSLPFFESLLCSTVSASVANDNCFAIFS